MKLIAIELVGFGKWQQYKIEFLPKNQLLFGANEAGKSTIYQFIQAMLFGFPAKGKRKKDYQPKDGAAYGGRLWFAHPVYGEVQVERFKGQNKGQAKVYFNDQIGDEALLEKMIHPLTKELFQSVFTFQQEQLSQLEKLNEEELQTSLLSLGLSGSQQLLLSREDYFKSAQTIYKGKGSQPPLNQKLHAYQKLQQRINDKEQQERPFQQLNVELSDTEHQIATQRQAAQEIKNQLALVEKQVMNLPLYEELQSIEQAKTTALLKPEEQEELLAIYQQHRFLSEELTRLNQEIAAQSETEDHNEDYQFYLKEEEQIQQLLNQRYDIDKLLSEISWMTQSLQQNQQEMFPLERQWGWNSETPPQLSFEEQVVKEMRDEIVARAVKLQTTQTDLQLLEEEITTREDNLSTFETINKEMFRKNHRQPKKAVNFVFCGFAGIIVLLSFFLPVPIRYGAFFLSAGLLIAGVLPLFHQPKDNYENEKRQWQEKLSQLDYLNDQLVKIKSEIKKIREEETEMARFIAQKVKENNLGRMDQVEFWVTHRTDITRYLILRNTNQELEHQLKEDQKRVTVLAEQTERYTARLPIAGTSLAERIRVISNFADKMEKVRFAQEYQADAYSRQTIREVKEKQQQVIDQARPLLQRFQIGSINEIPEMVQSYQKATANHKRKQELQTMLVGLYPDSSEPKQFPSSQRELAQSLDEIEACIQQLQEKEQKILYQRQQMLSDGTLDELYQEQTELKTEIEELALDWSAYQLSGQLLMDLLNELSEKQLPNLLKKATDYFKLLTRNAYRGIQLHEEQLIVIREDQQRFMLHELSTGTRDQVIMAVRFAFLSLQEQRNLCPIIIDDGWLHYDSQRKEQLAQLFAVFSEHQQVICFSSDQEMVSYYKELKQPIIELEGA
ncbi:AAA family ATPase [Enterococcus plantarum]|uniref:ATP-binding protein n=1 Tax=Enterococcus plantarum TaxID=1077675 RepID=UPI001A8E0D7A|nr:AAA family ATPase [Enterococcus plantarum]MBO0468157.1 AAA family ATPase [Enterococcus plantarum]